MSSRQIQGKVSVGCPPSREGWKSFMFHFHDFTNLATTRNHYVPSPEFTCNGHQWQLRIYPGGNSEAADGRVSVFLHHVSDEYITVSYTITNKWKTKKAISSTKTHEFFDNHGKGMPNFISRAGVLDESRNILDDNGTLTFIVSIEEEPTDVFVPKNPFANILEEMFNDEASADICFEVSSSGGKENDDRNKRVKTTTPFYAHRLILQKRAPMLAALCESNESGGVVTTSVNDVKPEIFRHLLSYVYGGSIPEEELKTQAKDIIAAADKYSIVNLKLAAEAAYVETDISLDNAMDNLLYADSRNLALLKEAVMNFLAENHFEAAANISFTDFPMHIVKDLLIAFGRKDRNGTNDEDEELATLSVSALRRKLHKMGLEVDGSREAMIETIKSHSEEEVVVAC